MTTKSYWFFSFSLYYHTLLGSAGVNATDEIKGNGVCLHYSKSFQPGSVMRTVKELLKKELLCNGKISQTGRVELYIHSAIEIDEAAFDDFTEAPSGSQGLWVKSTTFSQQILTLHGC